MILFIIVGMALVTAIPRLIPAFLVDKLLFRDWVNHWLQAIPYAALGALIFPGILFVVEGKMHIGLFGGMVAFVLAFFGVNIVLVVIAAIFAVYLLTM